MKAKTRVIGPHYTCMKTRIMTICEMKTI